MSSWACILWSEYVFTVIIIIKWKYHFCFGWNKTCSQNVSLVSVSYPASSKLKLSCPQWIELHGTEWCFMFFCSNAFSQVQNRTKTKNKRRRLSVHSYQYEVWSIRNINVYCFNSVVVACCSYSPFSASVMFIHTRWMFISWINGRGVVVSGIIWAQSEKMTFMLCWELMPWCVVPALVSAKYDISATRAWTYYFCRS